MTALRSRSRAAPKAAGTPTPAAASTPARPPRWATEAFWRAWAGRLLALWALLTLLLIGLRVATSGIRPDMRAAEDEHALLLAERDRLSLEVQTLSAPARIREWAEENEMVRFTDAVNKHRADFGTGVSAPPEPTQAGADNPDTGNPDTDNPSTGKPDTGNTVQMRLEWQPQTEAVLAPTPAPPTPEEMP